MDEHTEETGSQGCALCPSQENLRSLFVSVASCSVLYEGQEKVLTYPDSNKLHDTKVWGIVLCWPCRARMYTETLKSYYKATAFHLFTCVVAVGGSAFMLPAMVQLRPVLAAEGRAIGTVMTVMIGLAIVVIVLGLVGGLHTLVGWLANLYGYILYLAKREPPRMPFAGTDPFEAAALVILQSLERDESRIFEEQSPLPAMPAASGGTSDSDEEPLMPAFRWVLYSGETPEQSLKPDRIRKRIRYDRMVVPSETHGFRKMNDLSYTWTPSPHTADLAIAISASDHSGLFRAALDGLLGSLEIDQSTQKPSEITESVLHQESGGIESNLVDFLNECIYLMEVEDLIPLSFRSIDYSRDILDAVLICRPVVSADSEAIGHIKAATYSDLEVRLIDGRYQARIVFDT